MTPADPKHPPTTPRTRPLVWVKTLVLLKSIEPWDEIRPPIQFSTGLNIIQGESNDSDDEFQTGHGIGKTTVCRLIRYCLGEETYGQSHVMEEVKSNFPDGYVGAEIGLNGTAWAVLLPFRKTLRKYAAEGVVLGELVQTEGAKRYDDFIEKLSATVLAGVTVTESLTGGAAPFSRSRSDGHWCRSGKFSARDRHPLHPYPARLRPYVRVIGRV